MLIAAKMPVEQLYLWSALPFVIGAIACFALMRALQGGERQQIQPAAAAVSVAETAKP